MASGLLLYGKTINFHFVDYDDRHLIVSNQKFISDIANIPRAFFRDVFDVKFHSSSKSYYRPILTTSLIIDAQVGGTAPTAYHISNIIYHISASCLLFLLFLYLGYARAPALFLSLVFTVHPLLSQAVVWIPGRNDSLLAIFVILAFLSFIRFLESGFTRYFIMHLISIAAALFTKETALTAFAVLILYALMFRRQNISLKKGLFLSAGWIAIILSWYFLRSTAIENSSITLAHILQSLYTNSPSLIQYLGKIFFPVNLTVYPIMKDMPFIYGILSLAALSAAVYFSRNKNIRMRLFGAAWFLAFFLPSMISAKPGAESMFLEHRAYVPMIGILLILIETDIVSRLKLDLRVSTLFAALIIIVFGYTAFSHSNAMKNPFTYWMNAVEGSPRSAVARINLGDKYYSARRLDLAEREFRKAVELDPSQPLAHNNLGRIYAVRGMMKEAGEEFRKEIAVNPSSDLALYNLGTLNYDLGNLDNAVEYWLEATRVNPYNINANRYLAAYYYKNGMLSKAERYINKLGEMGINVFNRKSP